jgi:xylulokinase
VSGRLDTSTPSRSTELLLGIDIGTGSTKAVLVNPHGELIASATRAHAMAMPRPGWAEMDAESIWWGDVVALCGELLPQVGMGRITGVCVSGLGPCLLLCDQEGRPLRPAILYGIDMRAVSEIAELTERYGADEIVRRGGTALSTQAVGPKMLWVQRHEPEVWSAARRWYNSNSFIAGRLTGEYVLDHHTASQCVPLYEIKQNTWVDDWTADLAGALERPRLVWPHEVIGRVTAQAASETGLPLGTPVSAGTVDAWSEAFSVGVRRPGDLMMMYGSTMFLVQVLSELRSDPLLWTTVGVEPGTYTFAAGTSTAGSLTNWLQQLVGNVPFSDLVPEAALVPAGSDGLIVLPFFQGERTPIYDPQARGVIAGLTLRHQRGHIVRAVYEGIAYGLRAILESLDEAGGAATRIVAVGGGTKGDLWTQIVTDVLNRDQQIPAQTIGASYGDALLAAIGTGLLPPETDWAVPGHLLSPNPSNRDVYDSMYEIYRSLYPASLEQVHRLAVIQEESAAGSGT